MCAYNIVRVHVRIPLTPEAPKVTYTAPPVNGIGNMQYDMKDWGQLCFWDSLREHGQELGCLDFQRRHVCVTHG